MPPHHIVVVLIYSSLRVGEVQHFNEWESGRVGEWGVGEKALYLIRSLGRYNHPQSIDGAGWL